MAAMTMNLSRFVILPCALLWAAAGPAWAHADITGYSGSPGRGTCAGACHGNSGGTIVASGFPLHCTPASTYLITLRKLSGNSIRNSNASCRIGTGTQNAGVLSAGTGTATYNTTGETNGLHLSSSNRDSAMFQWTAPGAGTGRVTLYAAGLQGGYSGLNTVLTAVSEEAAPSDADVRESAVPTEMTLGPVYPNPFNAMLSISFALPHQQEVSLRLYNVLGQPVAQLANGLFAAGPHRLQWSSERAGTGVYFLQLQSERQTLTIKVVALK
jgi:hypothetical protein